MIERPPLEGSYTLVRLNHGRGGHGYPAACMRGCAGTLWFLINYFEAMSPTEGTSGAKAHIGFWSQRDLGTPQWGWYDVDSWVTPFLMVAGRKQRAWMGTRGGSNPQGPVSRDLSLSKRPYLLKAHSLQRSVASWDPSVLNSV